MRQTLLIILFAIFFSVDSRSCSCSTVWNDSFSLHAKDSEFVALVKILSYDEYLDSTKQRPYAMTAEIIKKFKGKELRNSITIYGDNGMLCRPYLDEFKIGAQYLIAPHPVDTIPNTAYEFWACRTDYLEVNPESKKASGKYSLIRYSIDLKSFEYKLKHGDWDYIKLVVGGLVLLLGFVIFKRNKKRNANKS